jgi:hypothetical protein
MTPFRLGPNDLLEYDARYGVLICRECQYAIQKNAMQSHLLRHKIYREQRQRLLSSIAQLNLFEPDDVPIPEPGSPAIDALPVLSGYRCLADECGNVCASYKRMRRHRSESHGLNENEEISDIARPAKLQTFFRGTKIRYFEVTPLPEKKPEATPMSRFNHDVSDGSNQVREYDEEEHDVQMHEIPPLPSCAPTPLRTPFKSPPFNIDLETMTYFHHYTSVTSLRLPCVNPAQRETSYWQTDFVLIALQTRWLMCGLLAIAAVHLAALASDKDGERKHRGHMVQLFSEFSVGWETSTEVDERTMIASVQIRRILRCTQDFIIPDFVLRSGGMMDDNAYGQEEDFSQARTIIHKTSSPGTSLPYGMTHSALLDRLGALPSRMTEVFGRPDSTRDVLVILAAIASLAECCSTEFSSIDADAAWRAMVSWLAGVPDHFHYMVSRHDLAALVVVAHWAAALVRQAEHCGCWFLKGSTETIFLYVEERLPRDNHAGKSLIEGLR